MCVSGPTIAPALLHPLHPFHHPHEGPRALVSVLNPHIFPTFTWQLHYTRIFYIMPPSRPSRRMLWSQWRSRHSHNTTECTRLRGNGTVPGWRLTVSCGISFSDFGSKIPRYEAMGGDMSLKISLSLSQNYLTEKNCVNAISLRGLLRIWCSLHISSVLNFLTLHSFVNHGFLDDIPRPLPFPQSDKKVFFRRLRPFVYRLPWLPMLRSGCW